MYKLITVFLFINFISNSWAKPKAYVVCLGKEEAYYHKNKVAGAYSQLNQQMISAVIQLSEQILLKPKYEKILCAQKFSSLEMLKLLITEQTEIFIIQATNTSQRAVAQNSVKELHDKSYYLFIEFINTLQAQMKTPHCMTNKIQEIKPLFEKLRHTLEDVGMKQIFKEIKDINVIFNKLQDPILLKGC